LLSHVARTRGTLAASPESPLVIEHREALIYMICEAAEMEHALMCEYLFAAFSLKDRPDEGLSARQLEAVQRWRKVVSGVAAEEMLHLTLTANMLTAVGASPHLSRPNLPQPARHYPPGVVIALLPFGEQALRHFMFLERPEGVAIDDAEGLQAVAAAAPLMAEDEIVPRLQDFATVGHLYRAIEAGFRHLAEKLGEERLFVGPPEAQVTQSLFSWPQLQPVTNLKSAIDAIEAIVEQGEGSRRDWRDAHFGRFSRIHDEFQAMRLEDPNFEPARPVVAARVRLGESEAVGPNIEDERTARVADLFNVVYEVLLQLLYRLLSRIDETDAQRSTLADAAVGLMYDGIGPLGRLLTSLPVGASAPGLMAGAPFELFYQPDYLLPHRRAAWLVMGEHLGDAAAFAMRLSSTVSELGLIAGALRGHADRIVAEAGS
jgi:Ferritin-like